MKCLKGASFRSCRMGAHSGCEVGRRDMEVWLNSVSHMCGSSGSRPCCNYALRYVRGAGLAQQRCWGMLCSSQSRSPASSPEAASRIEAALAALQDLGRNARRERAKGTKAVIGHGSLCDALCRGVGQTTEQKHRSTCGHCQLTTTGQHPALGGLAG